MATAIHSASPQRPDLSRSVALGLAVAVNLAALGALTVLQPDWQMPLTAKPAPKVFEVDFIRELPPVPEMPLTPPRPEMPPVAVAPVPPVTAPVDFVVSSDFATPTEALPALEYEMSSAGSDFALPAMPVLPDRDAGVAVADPSPPPYPVTAIRGRHEGTVILLVQVGVDGSTQDVRVVRSSGHRELDRSAVEHVTRSWSFQPAIRDGKPAAARVRVPIEFSLRTR